MKANGGPAFPNTHVIPKQGDLEMIPGWEGREGMTLRDYFSAKALMGMLAHGDPRKTEYLVKDAYALADAMIEEREK